MRGFLGHFLAAFVVASHIFPPAHAQEEGDEREQEQDLYSVSIYGADLGNLTPEIERAIAMWANPIILAVPEGTSPNSAALDACPSAGQAYFDVFSDRVTTLNPHLSGRLDTSLEVPRMMAMFAPNCLQSQVQIDVVEQDEVLSTDFQQQYLKGFGDREFSPIQSNPTQTFLSSVAALNDRNQDTIGDWKPGDQIILPLPRADFTSSSEGALAISNSISSQFGADAVEFEQLNSIGAIQSEDVSQDGVGELRTCSGITEAQLLMHNTSVLARSYESFFLNITSDLAKGQRNPRPANVLILDTGLPFTDWWHDSGFVKHMPNAPKDQLFVSETFRGDQLDSTIELYEALQQPSTVQKIQRHLVHTEAVLGAALGGYYGYLFNSSFGIVEPRVHSIFDDVPVSGSQELRIFTDDHKIAAGISRATQLPASFIVNISAATNGDPLGVIENALEDATEKNDLIVAAAGNFGTNYLQEGSSQYPANYGSSEEYPLIVVGGYKYVFSDADERGKPRLAIWDSSNHGGHVHILAPACDVQTIAFQTDEHSDLFQLEHVNGTSLAAPSVTYAAALVQHLLSHAVPLDNLTDLTGTTKNRILASSDLYPEFSEHVQDGRVLNLAKAVNLFSDLVEVEPGIYKRGIVAFGDGVTAEVKICDGLRIKTEDVLKIAKWQEDGMDTYLHYYLDPATRRLSSCIHHNLPRMSFEEVNASSVSSQGFQLNNFVDLVFGVSEFD